MSQKFYRKMMTEHQIRADERNRMAKELSNLAFHVFVDTDGCKSIKVHEHYEGIQLAEEFIKTSPVENIMWVDYATEVLKLFYLADARDELIWLPTDSQEWPIDFYAECSDTFGWALADAEKIEQQDILLLKQCLDDLFNVQETHRSYIEMTLPVLFSARKRDRQPMRLWIEKNTDKSSVHRQLFESLPDKGEI